MTPMDQAIIIALLLSLLGVVNATRCVRREGFRIRYIPYFLGAPVTLLCLHYFTFKPDPLLNKGFLRLLYYPLLVASFCLIFPPLLIEGFPPFLFGRRVKDSEPRSGLMQWLFAVLLAAFSFGLVFWVCRKGMGVVNASKD